MTRSKKQGIFILLCYDQGILKCPLSLYKMHATSKIGQCTRNELIVRELGAQKLNDVFYFQSTEKV